VQLQIVIASTYGLMLINKIERKKKGFEKKRKRERRKRVFFYGEKLKVLHHIYIRKFDKYQGDTDFQVEKSGLYYKRMPPFCTLF